MSLLTVYQPAFGFEEIVKKSLLEKGADLSFHEGLILSNSPAVFCPFSQNTWFNAEVIPFTSIKEASDLLKKRGKHWVYVPTVFKRRGQLIAEKLVPLPKKPLHFPTLIRSKLGHWTLLDETHLVLSNHTSSLFPSGIPHFEEWKEGPPSRAYLKLMEALTIAQKFPESSDVCLELGASPGSWTYLLLKLGCKVTAVDRAPLEIPPSENLTVLTQDAFQCLPEKIGPVDWLFSDLICYPEKLYEFVMKWIEKKAAKNFICTLKFQEGANYSIAEKFLEIEGSQVLHLHHNKHELTWILLSKET